MRDEQGFTGAEFTIRQVVRQLRPKTPVLPAVEDAALREGKPCPGLSFRAGGR